MLEKQRLLSCAFFFTCIGYASDLWIGYSRGNKYMWIPLVDYSNKYSISVSTLRRRIKSKSLEFKLDGGKYFILDEPLVKKSPGRRSKVEKFLPTYFENEEVNPVSTILSDDTPSSVLPPQDAPGSPPGATFSAVEEESCKEQLDEKDSVIFDLQKQIADLKTLVSILESEIERLKYF